MQANQIKDNEMPLFIQALYGVILGVGFLQGKDILQDELDLNSLFQLLFFLFSMFIVAHDWYIYHPVPVKRPEKFWYYSLQISSMFFLSQMVIVSADMSIGYGTIDWWKSVKDSNQLSGFKKADWLLESEIKGKGFWSLLKNPIIQWYVFGLFYTACNFFNLFLLSQVKKLRDTSLFHYGAHVAICLAAFWLLYVYNFSNAVCFLVLVGSIIAVVLLWQRREGISNSPEVAMTVPSEQYPKVKIRIRLSGTKGNLKFLQGVNIEETDANKMKTVLKKIEITKSFLDAEGDNKDELKKDNTDHAVFVDSLAKDDGDRNYRKALADLFK